MQEDVHWVDPVEFEFIDGLEHGSYSFEQRLGELVIVPHNAPHCVINHGGITFACAANIIDVTVADSAFTQSLLNKKLKVKTVYKVAGAIWGTMLQNKLPREQMKKLISVCSQILDFEKKGMARIEKYESAPEAGLDFVNFVECDFCLADVFNSYVRVGQDKTFCTDEMCLDAANEAAKEASSERRKKEKVLKVVPRTLDALRQQLKACRDKNK